MRQRFREAVRTFTDLGIPSKKRRAHARIPGLEPREHGGDPLVPAREAPGARRQAGRARDAARHRLVVGLAGAEHGAGRPGQGGGGLHLALGAEPAALRRPRRRRPGLRSLARRRPDHAATRRPLPDRRPRDHLERHGAARPGDGRLRHRVLGRLRAGRARRARPGRRRRRRGRRARDHLVALPRQSRGVPPRARAGTRDRGARPRGDRRRAQAAANGTAVPRRQPVRRPDRELLRELRGHAGPDRRGQAARLVARKPAERPRDRVIGPAAGLRDRHRRQSGRESAPRTAR